MVHCITGYRLQAQLTCKLTPFPRFLDNLGMVSADALQTRDELGYFSKQGMKIRDHSA